MQPPPPLHATAGITLMRGAPLLVTVTGVEDDNLVKQAVEDAGFTYAGEA
ncbi:hypothetical protein [Sedimenticola hydrogenitrophicus]|nr:hypothetical protein [Sedimenticola hydrogenitrophicus]